MKKLLFVGMTLVMAMSFAMTVTAGDKVAGKVLFGICVACHAANGAGNAALNAPAIAGQEDWYIVRQLNNFKVGARGTHAEDAFGMQMRPMSMTLVNDKAVEDVAAYVASLPPVNAAATIGGDVNAGKMSFVVCASCHGADGKGNKVLNAPSIAGQHDWYLQRQLKNFKAGIRGVDSKDIFGLQMRPMSMILPTDNDVKNVASYINSLKK
ncbi:c-type cytochrome [Deltaproteobacteria bacterium TL4]